MPNRWDFCELVRLFLQRLRSTTIILLVSSAIFYFEVVTSSALITLLTGSLLSTLELPFTEIMEGFSDPASILSPLLSCLLWSPRLHQGRVGIASINLGGVVIVDLIQSYCPALVPMD